MTDSTTWTFGGNQHQITDLRRTITSYAESIRNARQNLHNHTEPANREYLNNRIRDLTRQRNQFRQQLKDARQSPNARGRTYKRSAIIRALKKWPQITHVAFEDHGMRPPSLRVVFIPVMFEDACSSLLGFEIHHDGGYFSLNLPPDGEYPAHPHMAASICLGNAAEAWLQAKYAGDIFAAIAVLQEYRLTHNPRSELEPWRSRAISWWRRHVLDQPQGEILGWDKHTIAAPNYNEPETVGYIEWIYEKPLSQIINTWYEGDEDNEDNEDEDSCRWHCEMGDHCLPDEDEAGSCKFCSREGCNDCLMDNHYRDEHEADQCEHMKASQSGGGHYQCEEITQNTCPEHEETVYICDECLPEHNEQDHPEEEEEEDAPILPNIEQPGQLQLMTVLGVESEPTQPTQPIAETLNQ